MTPDTDWAEAWIDFYVGDADVRERAVAALSAAPLPMLLPYLLAALHDPDLTLVAAACPIVAAQGIQAAAPRLAELHAGQYRGYDHPAFNATVTAAQVALHTATAARPTAAPDDPASQLAAYPTAPLEHQAMLLLEWAALPPTPETQALARAAVNAPEPVLRLAAIYTVGQLCRAEAGAVLPPLWAHPDPATRAAALRALHPAQDKPPLATLLPLLKDPVVWVQAEAVALLGAYRQAHRMTVHTDAEIASLLHYALLPEAETLLVNAAAPDRPAVVRRAALAALDSPRGVYLLVQALQHAPEALQRLALYRLAQWGHPAALRPLQEFRQRVGPLGELARYALHQTVQRQLETAPAPPIAVAPLLHHLAQVTDRSWVWPRLGEMGAAVLPQLRAAAAPADIQQKLWLCYALALVGTVADIELVLPWRDSYLPDLSVAAGSALLAIGARVLANLLTALAAVTPPADPPQLQGVLGDGQALLLLWAALRDMAPYTQPGVGKTALLAALQPVKVWLVETPCHTALLNDRELEVQRAAADLLGWLGDARAIPWLLARWAHPGLRPTLARALGQLRAGAAYECLVQGLHMPDPATRGNAAWALAQLPGVESAPLLSDQLVVETHPFVRECLAQAVAQLTTSALPGWPAAEFAALTPSVQRALLAAWRSAPPDALPPPWLSALAAQPDDGAGVSQTARHILGQPPPTAWAPPGRFERLISPFADEPTLFRRRTPPPAPPVPPVSPPSQPVAPGMYPPPAHDAAGAPAPPLPGARWVLTCTIAGAAYQEVDAILPTLAPTAHLGLRREPENPHDAHAILVLTAVGRKLGYIPRAQNPELAAWLDAGGAAFAVWGCQPAAADLYTLRIHVYQVVADASA